jgi:hypothetical protein
MNKSLMTTLALAKAYRRSHNVPENLQELDAEIAPAFGLAPGTVTSFAQVHETELEKMADKILFWCNQIFINEV